MTHDWFADPAPHAGRPVDTVASLRPMDAPGSGSRNRGALAEAVHAVPVGSVRKEIVRELFSDVLRRHSRREAEARFASLGNENLGSPTQRIPRPWLFLRVLALLGGSFLGLLLLMDFSDNPILIPGVILLGAFAVPISLSIFALECNTPRNISFYAYMKFVVAGAILSLAFATLLFEIDPELQRQFGASSAGMIEEPAKLAAVVVLARGISLPWTLNGITLGAAVGAGFAAFETAGYGFVALLEGGLNINEMTDVLVLRAWTSVGTHVVWTAIAAAALWRVTGGSRLRGSALVNPRFLGPFVLVMALHFIWNSDWAGEAGIIAYATITAFSVAVALGFIIVGANQYVMNRRVVDTRG